LQYQDNDLSDRAEPVTPQARTSAFSISRLEMGGWIGLVLASIALGFGVYHFATKPFTTTVTDRLALPKELAVTSANAAVPLPPELIQDGQPAIAATTTTTSVAGESGTGRSDELSGGVTTSTSAGQTISSVIDPSSGAGANSGE
jgi:hypothetical protein